MNLAFALVEVIWIVQGRNDAAFLTYWNSELPKYVGKGKRMYGAYGFRLRRSRDFDQLRRAFDTLRNLPESRQVVLQIWDSQRDLPAKSGRPRAADIPCNVSSILKVRNGALEWLQIMRSNDIFRGMPYNLVQFTYLQEIVAGWLGLKLGTYNHIADSLHLYAKDKAEAVSVRFVPKNIDSISLEKKNSDKMFSELEKRIEKFVLGSLPKEKHAKLAEWPDAPEAFQNILAVIAAEGARRRGWKELSNELMAPCTNPAYLYLWKRWLERTNPNV